MNILLFDNGTKYLSGLNNLLGKLGKVTIANNPSDLSSKDADLIVLSGGHHLYVTEHPEAYQTEIEFIKTSKKPILGVCLGAELIAYAFGAKLEFLNYEESGLINIMVLQKDNVFKDISDFKVYENHKLAITSLPKELIGLAKSKTGFEVFKHNTKPIYGFQFHPEMFEDKACGDEILRNLIQSLNR